MNDPIIPLKEHWAGLDPVERERFLEWVGWHADSTSRCYEYCSFIMRAPYRVHPGSTAAAERMSRLRAGLEVRGICDPEG